MEINLEEVSKLYGITDKELRATQAHIVEMMLHGKVPSNNPTAIFDIGPAGSGKTGLNGYAVSQFPNNNIIVVNNDELKPFYPKADEISKIYPEHYIKVTNEASKVWTDELMNAAINGKYNVLYEGTGRKIKIFERMISEMKRQGYKIIVRAMAVDELNCLMSIIERYGYQVQQKGWGRLVSLETFYKAYSNEMLDTLDAFEKSSDISLVIDTAARLAFRRNIGKITMALLEEAVANTKPSLTIEQIKQHEAIRDRFEGNKPKKTERRRVGF